MVAAYMPSIVLNAVLIAPCLFIAGCAFQQYWTSPRKLTINPSSLQASYVSWVFLFRLLFIGLTTAADSTTFGYMLANFWLPRNEHTCDVVIKCAATFFVGGQACLYSLLLVRLYCAGVATLADSKGNFLERKVNHILLMLKLAISGVFTTLTFKFALVKGKYEMIGGHPICVIDMFIWFVPVLYGLGDLALSILFATLFAYQVIKVSKLAGNTKHKQMLRDDLWASLVCVINTSVVMYGLGMTGVSKRPHVSYSVTFFVIPICSYLNCALSYAFTRPFQISESSNVSAASKATHTTTHASVYENELEVAPSPSQLPESLKLHEQQKAAPKPMPDLHLRVMSDGRPVKSATTEAGRFSRVRAQPTTTRPWWQIKMRVFGLTRVTEGSEGATASRLSKAPHEQESIVEIRDGGQHDKKPTNIPTASKQERVMSQGIIPPDMTPAAVEAVVTEFANDIQRRNSKHEEMVIMSGRDLEALKEREKLEQGHVRHSIVSKSNKRKKKEKKSSWQVARRHSFSEFSTHEPPLENYRKRRAHAARVVPTPSWASSDLSRSQSETRIYLDRGCGTTLVSGPEKLGRSAPSRHRALGRAGHVSEEKRFLSPDLMLDTRDFPLRETL
eukprot:g22611.t1